MKTKILIGTGIVLILAAAIIVAMKSGVQPTHTSSTNSSERDRHAQSDINSSQQSAKRVPAFQEAPSAKLPATLPPERFIGKTQAAYRAVREIPETIAQLPCYCYCDRGHGHKSLHSCYEDEHAASCAVCVEEVLLAYRLEKEQGMTPAQIRQAIIDKYGPTN